MGLTAWNSVPGTTINYVAVLLEVLVVTDTTVWIGHHQVSGSIDGSQPAKEGVVGSRGILLWRPVPGAVKGVGDHQLTAMQVCT